MCSRKDRHASSVYDMPLKWLDLICGLGSKTNGGMPKARNVGPWCSYQISGHRIHK